MGMALIALGGCIPALFAPDWGFVLFCHGLGLGVGGALLGTFQHVLGKRLPDVCALTCALGLELMLAFPLLCCGGHRLCRHGDRLFSDIFHGAGL